jgi:hypothetical protein
MEQENDYFYSRNEKHKIGPLKTNCFHGSVTARESHSKVCFFNLFVLTALSYGHFFSPKGVVAGGLIE